MGKRVLVTGAASGLGLALAQQFLSRGDRVIFSDRYSVTPENVQKLIDQNKESIYRKLDVTEESDWLSVQEFLENSGGIDVIVNNAGIVLGNTVEGTEITQLRRIIDINLIGVVRGTMMVLPMMKKANSGQIINIASLAGIASWPEMSNYNIVKAGVISFTESLANELRLENSRISAHVAAPGYFRTYLYKSMPGTGDREKVQTDLLTGSPRTSEQVARAILRGVATKRTIIPVGFEAYLAYYNKRLCPFLFHRVNTWFYSFMKKRDGWPLSLKKNRDRYGANV